MAGHTVSRRVIRRITVTIDTPSHVKFVLRRHHVHGVDLSVTGRAVKISIDVWLVREPSVVWKVVHLDPLDWLAGIPCLLDLLDLGGLGQHQTVTVHARVRSGYR